mgnify:CR=1 FL=1
MKEQRLPQNGKEGFLYGGTICLITVIVMLILNISTSLNKFDFIFLNLGGTMNNLVQLY